MYIIVGVLMSGSAGAYTARAVAMIYDCLCLLLLLLQLLLSLPLRGSSKIL
jgi:hypothetical protein